MSLGLIFTSSLKRRKPANASRQAVARRMSDREFDLTASSTILPNNSTDTSVKSHTQNQAQVGIADQHTVIHTSPPGSDQTS